MSDIIPRGAGRLFAMVIVANITLAALIIGMIAYAVKWVIS